jgi:TPP-dependent pyruvate/acetoin dehydrogenase alpha subunit
MFDKALDFYRQMVLIRRVEETLLELFDSGQIEGTVHTSIGQEACAVGVINALDRSKDVVFSSHRAHGHFIAYCDDVEGLVAELMGKSSGVCGGIGGTQNLHKWNLYTSGIQGGIVPCAAGAALAEKLNRTGAITAVFLGDGTLGQGVVYETMNVASLWSLPLLFVLEDNGYAQSTSKRLQHAGELAERPITFGIDTLAIDADDVFQVHEAACSACAQVRATGRPFFLTLRTYRLAPHSKGDDLRPLAEIQAYQAKDPLGKLSSQLTPNQRKAVEMAVEDRVAQAVAAAAAHDPLSVDEFDRRV